jgi:hypothetical protein
VQGQVPTSELNHAGPADHRRLTEREQHQADSVARRSQFLTRSRSSAAHKIAVVHWRIKPN